jgi:hypothetical protein
MLTVYFITVRGQSDRRDTRTSYAVTGYKRRGSQGAIGYFARRDKIEPFVPRLIAVRTMAAKRETDSIIQRPPSVVLSRRSL